MKLFLALESSHTRFPLPRMPCPGFFHFGVPLPLRALSSLLPKAGVSNISFLGPWSYLLQHYDPQLVPLSVSNYHWSQLQESRVGSLVLYSQG